MSVSLFNKVTAFGQGGGLRAQLVRGSIGVGGLKLLSLPITIATSILLARGLGPEGYGQYVFVIAVVSMLALPVGPGLGQLITREVARYHHGGEWRVFRGLLRRAHQWVGIGSALVVLGIAAVAASQADWSLNDRWSLLFLASVMLPLLGLNALRSSTLRGLRYVFIAQLPELLARPGLHLLFAGVLLLAGGLNPATALASQIMATAGAFLLGAWFLRRRQPAQTQHLEPAYHNTEWLRALLPFTLLAAMSMFNTQIGILALGWLGTDAEVAELRVAQSGGMLVALSLTIVNLVIGPHIIRAHRENDQNRLRILSRQSARAAVAVAVPIALPLIILGEPIVHLVYGQAYSTTAPTPLAILAAAQLVNVAFGSVGLFLTMIGYERDTLYGHVVALLVNIVAAVVLIPPLGAVGAALAVAVGLVTWNLVLAVKFMQRLGFRPSAF